jgi:hypothetical protein
MKLYIVAMALLMGVGQIAHAKDKPAPAVNASDKESFTTVSAWVRTQMKDGGRYAETDATERARVNARLDDMAALFEIKGSVDKMSTDEKVTLLNSQEEINAILGKRDGDRLICKRERPLGSNIPVKTCETARQVEERRRKDSKDIRDRQINKQKKWG